MAHRKGKATHGSLGGNSRQMGEHRAGGRTSNKPGGTDNRGGARSMRDPSSGEQRPTTGGGRPRKG